MDVAPPSLDKLAAVLQDRLHDQPLDARFRSLFALKGLASVDDAASTKRVIDIIDAAFNDNDSALLKHELAYVLGQIQHEDALDCLTRVLEDEAEHPMVRHEAAEAMGAISSPRALPILERYLRDANVSVRETCELALQKIRFDHSSSSGSGSNGLPTQEGKESEGAALARARASVAKVDDEEEQRKDGDDDDDDDDDDDVVDGAFLPIDPAPAHTFKSDKLLASIPLYKAQMTAGESLPLFTRYRAMFSLRNAVHAARRRAQRPNGTTTTQERAACNAQAVAAVEALAAGLTDASALFRHEICFVFGELAHPASVESMVRVLGDEKEEEMVRHEAAEALGAVAEDEDEEGRPLDVIMGTLKRWAEDEGAPRVVRESCVVALDEMAYNNDPSQFQPVQ